MGIAPVCRTRYRDSAYETVPVPGQWDGKVLRDLIMFNLLFILYAVLSPLAP